ncbi:uncharacterized protein CIMG_06250 [Coccidioides immitis RS]|uniref:Methyltransferase domain-containing protein n=4 Tax=Coccidioides immitis TaxID=5501 RepID=A0A0E1RVV5_COCIM|nr:uncharacterized protein CIMG_06250 [Coccidioides immitis RS]KMP03352.1 hypothetical protein CIRG_03044 [Coccidioides immitis RMSCC 2394]KMU73891.1 hypothetical protein CISG_03869 [Coccidioides immitis RMSCC 3703]KMU84933.1 hypothetical protein CIHG_02716 [Coccidioides immitis H538.4]TPX23669.1 hypothetical protein DIZ76_013005 [Coccidioides immitis]EAS30771.1 hypothetical protein CIMG_06250 [Coccidioides immitis RS]
MARSCSPLFITFAIACVILFAAFNSDNGASLKKAASSLSKQSAFNGDLVAKLGLYERLWKENINGRKKMKAFFDNNKGKDRKFPKGYSAPYTLYDFVYPAFNCPYELERVGREGDGGKWVCGMSRYEANKNRPCIVYSFGVNDDSAFEDAVLRRTNCEIWGYDFSVGSWAKNLDQSNASRAHFLQAGISNVTDTDRSPPFYSVKDLMKMNGHNYIDIMKMDIEGSEFGALTSFLTDFQDQDLPLGQLLVETHVWEATPQTNYLLPRSLSEWIGFWEHLESRGLREVSVEPNLLGNTWYGSPVFAEVTLINIFDKKSLLVN